MRSFLEALGLEGFYGEMEILVKLSSSERRVRLQQWFDTQGVSTDSDY